MENNKEQIIKDLQVFINRCSLENGSDTPDFILAEFMATCLSALNNAIRRRDAYYDRTMNEKLMEIKSV